MWSQIDVSDVARLESWLDIARQMDPRYQLLQLGDVRTAVRRKQGEAWHYQAGRVQMSMFFQYSAPRGHWQVLYVGFVGGTSAEDGVELIVEMMRDFMAAHNVSYLTGVRPPSMEDPLMQQVHNLVPRHPNLRITVERAVEAGELWKIEYVPP